MSSVREVPLSQGKVALVDEEDYERVSRYKWHAVKSAHGELWYAFHSYQVDKKIYHVGLHRFILKLGPRTPLVDHRNRNGLDCRRENLRVATHSQNVTNIKMSVRNTSGYRGVILTSNKTKPWQAQTKKDRKSYYLGLHATAEEAARAYDKAAKRIHGEFAVLNFPEKEEGDAA